MSVTVAFSVASLRLQRLRSANLRRLFQHEQGRCLAARAAQQVLGLASTDSLQVTHDANGRPWLQLDGKPNDVDVSISHSGACVVAAAVRGARVGIDVEPQRDVPRRLWRFFLRPEEMAQCEQHPQRSLWIWMVKEALYKAMNAQRPINFKEMQVLGWGSDMQLSVLGDDAPRVPRVHLREHLGFNLAVVTL